MSLKADDIIGTWFLEEFTIEKDGVVNPWREGTSGMLIYSNDGHMSLAVDSELGEDDLDDAILFYAGTWSLEGNLIHHHVRNATGFDRIGKTMTRNAVMLDGKLELSASGDFGTGRILWRRATNQNGGNGGSVP